MREGLILGLSKFEAISILRSIPTEKDCNKDLNIHNLSLLVNCVIDEVKIE